MKPDSRIYIAGHRGLAGSAVVRRLVAGGYKNLVTRTHDQLDLANQVGVERFFEEERPEYVVLAAAKVGGILANNSYPAQFIYQNLAIQTNVLNTACRAGVKRLLFLGSSCIYPRDCPQPIKEEYLLTGPLEKTNRPYAVAKIAGIEMCWAYNREYGTKFLAVMPTNLYGPGDHYDLATSHVIPALIRKMHEAKISGAPTATVWGSGRPRREFLYSDDMADACVYLMNLPDHQFQSMLAADRADGVAPVVNVGVGEDQTIAELSQIVADVVGFQGRLIFDSSKPDGTPRKLLDSSRIRGLGWRASIPLKEGIQRAYQNFQEMQR